MQKDKHFGQFDQYWAPDPLGSDPLETLHHVESQLPISLLSTRELVCCKPDEYADEVSNRDNCRQFDHLPVKEEHILGMFNRAGDQSHVQVRDVMCPLNDSMLMAANSSMLHFLEEADHWKYVFVVEDRKISGLVTLSDVQKLAARPAIFLRVTLLEMMLAEWIRLNAEETKWLGVLDVGAAKNVERDYQRFVANNSAIDRISVTTFSQKIEIVHQLGALDDTDDGRERLDQIREMRNSLAHAHDIGADAVLAAQIAENMRNAKALVDHFELLMRP